MAGDAAPDAGREGAVTVLLQRMAAGEAGVLDELFPLVYGELRRIARGQRRRGATLDTTGLLHEAYLRFARRERHVYNHRQHFYAVAAKAMRQILLDEAKRRLRAKRGGGAQRASLDPEQLRIEQQAEMMIALDQGLEKLGRVKERAKQVVEYRFFGGLTEEETARLLDVDVRTVRRDWAQGRAWLAVELGSP
ncbi:MAG: ECF-type sigma factor [Acidobacteriota bacterium]